MKDNKQQIAMIVAALVSLGQSVRAENSNLGSINEDQQDFIPFESLQPEVRLQFQEQIQLLRKTVKIDWSNITMGLNSQGQISLKARPTDKLANPTCYSM